MKAVFTCVARAYTIAVAAYLMAALGAQAQTITQAITPPAVQQYFDNNGAPLASGSVGYYVVGTLTPKTTYQDAAGTTPNTNPIALNSAGRTAVPVYGQGLYRQIVKDVSSNVIWDQVTLAPQTSNSAFGTINNGYVIGNATGAPAAPTGTSMTNMFDQAYCNTIGYAVFRFTGAWTCAKAIPANPVWWGADPTGVADSSTALNNCLASMSTFGGTCQFSTNNGNSAYYINTAITMPANTTIKCGDTLTGVGASNSVQSWNSMNRILLGNSGTIKMGNSTTLLGCLILPSGMSFPQTSSSAWTGTAVQIPIVFGGYNEITIRNTTIAGFGTCFDSYQGGSGAANRVWMEHVDMDCNTGANIGASFDTSRYMSVHVWPFATVTYCNTLGGSCDLAAVLGRSGYGIWLTGAGQDGTVVGGDSLALGHTVNLYLDARDIHVEGFWSDTANASPGFGGVGYGVVGSTNATTQWIDTLRSVGGCFNAGTCVNMQFNGNIMQVGNLYLDGISQGNTVCLGLGNNAKLLVATAVITNCNYGGGTIAGYVALGTGSYLQIATGSITTGASGSARTGDISVPANTNKSQVKVQWYSDKDDTRLSISSNALVYNTWSPTVTCTSGTITPGAVTAKYQNLNGATYFFQLQVPVSASSGCTALNVTMPYTLGTGVNMAIGKIDVVSGITLSCEQGATSNLITCVPYNFSGSPAPAGSTISVSGVFLSQ